MYINIKQNQCLSPDFFKDFFCSAQKVLIFDAIYDAINKGVTYHNATGYKHETVEQIVGIVIESIRILFKVYLDRMRK